MKKLLFGVVGIAVILLIVLAIIRTSGNAADPVAQRIHAEAALVGAKSDAGYDRANQYLMIVGGTSAMIISQISYLLLAVGVVGVIVWLVLREKNNKPPIIYISGGQQVEQLPVQNTAPIIFPVEPNIAQSVMADSISKQ